MKGKERGKINNTKILDSKFQTLVRANLGKKNGFLLAEFREVLISKIRQPALGH